MMPMMMMMTMIKRRRKTLINFALAVIIKP